MERDTVVLINSPNWAISVAIKHLFLVKGENVKFIFRTANESITCLLINNNLPEPDVIVLDESPRGAVALILFLRKRYPGVKLLFTRDCFLYSDRIVAEYFGGIWLQEYALLMASYPNMGVMECMSIKPQAPVRSFNDTVTVQSTLTALGVWLEWRLRDAVPSSRAREVVMEWLVKGIPPRKTAQCLGVSEKVVYHYRWLVMKALGIHHRDRDFVPALTVVAGSF